MAFAHSNIISHDYDSFSRKLTVYFLGGGKFDFHDVSYDIYDGLLHAKNKSAYFNEKIKDRFNHTKIY